MLIALIVLIVLAGIWISNLPPLFAHEVIAITVEGGFVYERAVDTLYSNRVVVRKGSKKLFISKWKLKKDAYAEILGQISLFPHDGHLTSFGEALSGFDGYAWSLRIDEKTYYTSLSGSDESLDNLILLFYCHTSPLWDN